MFITMPSNRLKLKLSEKHVYQKDRAIGLESEISENLDFFFLQHFPDLNLDAFKTINVFF